ncbi:MAG: hypothetical protein AB1679_32750 [Actinomycetota bacterium]
MFWEHGDETLAAQYPLRRLGTPEDVVVAASWITGQVLILDGGVSLSPRVTLEQVDGT